MGETFKGHNPKGINKEYHGEKPDNWIEDGADVENIADVMDTAMDTAFQYESEADDSAKQALSITKVGEQERKETLQNKAAQYRWRGISERDKAEKIGQEGINRHKAGQEPYPAATVVPGKSWEDDDF